MTKPITAVGALILVEECRLRLDDPVDDLLPELADRRVLVEPRGPIDGETVPAHRPITVHDVLTFRLGWGMDFTAPWPQPLLETMGAARPGRRSAGAADATGARTSGCVAWRPLPLLYQPGERWLYNTGPTCSACSSPGPPASRSTSSSASACSIRSGWSTPASRRRTPTVSARATPRIQRPAPRRSSTKPDGQWAKPPAFPSAGGGLVSTVDDMHAFGRMLLAGGRSAGRLPTVVAQHRSRR